MDLPSSSIGLIIIGSLALGIMLGVFAAQWSYNKLKEAKFISKFKNNIHFTLCLIGITLIIGYTINVLGIAGATYFLLTTLFQGGIAVIILLGITSSSPDNFTYKEWVNFCFYALIIGAWITYLFS